MTRDQVLVAVLAPPAAVAVAWVGGCYLLAGVGLWLLSKCERPDPLLVLTLDGA